MAGVTLSQSPAQLLALPNLSDEQAVEVRALAARAASVDGVGPLSEHAGHALTARGEANVQHLLAYAGDGLAGYAQVGGGADVALEMVVDPSHRREGVGSDLLGRRRRGAPRSPGMGPRQPPRRQGFAVALGLEPVRELHKMSRSLHRRGRRRPALPAGFSARAFVPGQDEQAWLEANAAAFARPPRAGADDAGGPARADGPAWFDPAGFILVEANDAPGAVAAFHWTKVDPEQRSTLDPAATAGEVYVVGVRPGIPGSWPGPARHRAGPGPPRRAGAARGRALRRRRQPGGPATYARLGFRSIMVDVMYSRAFTTRLSG